MKYGIIIFPSKPIQDLANSYRKRYDSHYALIPPHMTLKNTFEADEDKIKQITNQLRSIAKKYEPFTLKTMKVSSFKPVNNVIFFKVELTEELKKLHQDINQQINEQHSEYAFVPHITIGQNLTDDEHSDIYGALRMLNVTYEEKVERFHLLYQLENGSWSVLETFRLGNEA